MQPGFEPPLYRRRVANNGAQHFADTTDYATGDDGDKTRRPPVRASLASERLLRCPPGLRLAPVMFLLLVSGYSSTTTMAATAVVADATLVLL